MEPGTTGLVSFVVGEGDLASALALDAVDAFPPVFATSRMIGLMEVAAARAMRPLLQPGELSVGVTVDVTHTAPTPSGATVTAEARFLEMEGKLYVFQITARDPAGEIGRGRHKRAIIARDRLMAGAGRRASPA